MLKFSSVCRAACDSRTLHGTRYTHHNIIYNDVSLLIISRKV